MKITNSFELLELLIKNGFIVDRDPLWWPNSGTFEVVVGAVLTQQTKWENVEKSLQNLQENSCLHVDKLAQCDILVLEKLIRSSGFYRKKARNLKLLCQNIVAQFESFESFALHVNREWLLSQKGLGQESSDAILCYACKKDVMVVDAYTNRLVQSFGYEFESYSALQEWLEQGIKEHYEKVQKLYGRAILLHEVYARFHGKIVEFSKTKGELNG